MKISSRQYARTLMELIRGKNEKEAKALIERFVAQLVCNKDIKKSKDIIRRFNNIWNKESGQMDAIVTTGKELAKQDEAAIKIYIREKAGVKEVVLKKEVDDAIIGGAVIRYGDYIIDGSLRTKLINLKSKMSK